MKERRWLFASLAALLGLMLVAGCAPQETEDGDGDGQQQVDITALTNEWAESSHTVIPEPPRGRDFCISCHNGAAFAQGTGDPAELDIDYPVSVDCRACHTGQGAELIQSGETTIFSTDETLQFGSGAVCARCHNAEGVPDINNEERAYPHYGPNAPVVKGVGGIRMEGMEIGSTEDHADIENSCVDCHMLPAEEGHASHAFSGVSDLQAACGECHEDIESTNGTPTLEAAADYDGDGSVEQFTLEVEGLMEQLEEAIHEEAGTTDMSAFRGSIVFQSEEGTVSPEAISDPVYMAAYNWFLFEHDGSMGIHNPQFTIDLLQASYEQLTGEPLADAQPFGGEEGEEGAQEGTPTEEGGGGETTPTE